MPFGVGARAIIKNVNGHVDAVLAESTRDCRTNLGPWVESRDEN